MAENAQYRQRSIGAPERREPKTKRRPDGRNDETAKQSRRDPDDNHDDDMVVHTQLSPSCRINYC
jgi:hypothetical protein